MDSCSPREAEHCKGFSEHLKGRKTLHNNVECLQKNTSHVLYKMRTLVWDAANNAIQDTDRSLCCCTSGTGWYAMVQMTVGEYADVKLLY